MTFDQITLENGLRVIGERIPHFRSASVGLWLGAGSQFEAADEAGVSHFLEHMVFKGTERRTARQIAEEMDAVGGQLNAFTAKECTCFYARVVDEHLPLAMDVIADMATHPAFDPAEMEKEKGVVIEEIAMAEDTPEDLVHEQLMLAHYGDQAVARPILGTEASVSGCSRERLSGYWARMYRPKNAVLSVAGSYDWAAVTELAARLLGDWRPEGLDKLPCVTRAAAPGVVTREKDIEQTHICLGYPAPPLGDPRLYGFDVFNSVFGGAMSSRLFQKIREESGLAYTVYSCPNAYLDTGMLSVYAACSPENAAQVYDMILEEARTLAENGLTEAEFTMAREQMKAGFILGLESTSARMQANGRRLLLRGTTRTEGEIIERIEAVRFDEVNALTRETLTAPHSLALVGKGVDGLAERLKR